MANNDSTTKIPFVRGFAPPTHSNEVIALIHGEEAMRVMYYAIVGAKSYVYVADWQMTISVAMIREPSPRDNSRVGNVLGYVARKNVKVYVILWANPLHPFNVEGTLEDLRRRGIQAFSHRPSNKYTNHQKIVVVDGNVAFLGGIDLTEGRWDNLAHSVIDLKGIFEGDYYNSTLPKVNRDKDPRLPWHDVHCKIEGPAVLWVTTNFVQRWNSTKPDNSYDELPVPFGPTTGVGNKYVQVVRSLSKDTGAPGGQTEHSVLDAYITAIQMAEKFIFIENQYFISYHGKGPVYNQIMKTIADRIKKAKESRENFVVILVLPIMPEGGTLSAWTQQEQMHWQFRTLKRDKDYKLKPLKEVVPLWQRVQKEIGGSPDKYLSIHSLRGWAKKGSILFTEQIYPHVKTMIVDDRIAIIGSANINDRSMLGDRDSEIAAVIFDPETVETTMDRKIYKKANKFARELRLSLWKEHLGPLTEPEKKMIEDPITSHTFWKERSRTNTEAFLQAFPFVPRDSEKKLPKREIQNQRTIRATPQAEAALANVKGQLVDLPLDWLEQEDLETTGAPDNIFTEAPTEKPVKRAEA